MNWDNNSDEFLNMDEADFEDMLEKLRPDEFYFQFELDDVDGLTDHYFLITPKGYFDANKLLYDDWIPMNVFPPDFEELTECVYAYDGDSKVGRQLLLDAGFIEKKMV